MKSVFFYYSHRNDLFTKFSLLIKQFLTNVICRICHENCNPDIKSDTYCSLTASLEGLIYTCGPRGVKTLSCIFTPAPPLTSHPLAAKASAPSVHMPQLGCFATAGIISSVTFHRPFKSNPFKWMGLRCNCPATACNVKQNCGIYGVKTQHIISSPPYKHLAKVTWTDYFS